MVVEMKQIHSIVFYDKETKQVCAAVSDEEIIIPENCEIAIFPVGTEPVFYGVNGIVALKGALVHPFTNN